MLRPQWRLSTVAVLATGALVGCGLADGGGGDGESTTLRLSHQWPAADEGDGDFRSVLAERFAEDVEERTDGAVSINVNPANSLIEDPTEQYNAIRQGTVDMSVYPLDYAAGDHPEFSLTLMPAMVRNHTQAQNWQEHEVGQMVEDMADEAGLVILTWVWNAGAIASTTEDPILTPDDVPSGSVTRAAGPRIEEMLESVGFGLSSMPSSDIYNGIQTGTLDSAITSTSSFGSYRLYEQVDSYTSPVGGNTFWFMFEPLVIGKDQFEELTEEQQEILLEVGQDLQDFAYEESQADDERVDEAFEEAGVTVEPMDDDAFEEWLEVSEPVWDSFADDVEGGADMIEAARSVPAE
ncbi:TRAP transporter substrate-binding protein DctP [Spiractinospora alimapuensis]|uniref:TRAP transporter substrate-binding protein DctP n=1 Tax=Spiractinospora alimapuensis TaxID=2820884 RepID=UPI001F46EF8C|nr:TRAP transporter substrate-binding protein DctP [Spiractinospora alimapuensis]QVQ53905.1 TRAP transporter substrate-binding protein DctP [Spiractinospora alimapuensis]